jgi:hypothetical protein
MIRAQVPLIRSELWATTFLLFILGIVASMLFERTGFFTVIAPLIAAGCVATIYGKRNDEAYELLLSTPVAQTQILLSRLVLVFGYNLILFVISFLILRPLHNNPLSIALLQQWLAPMTFLSSFALLLSVSIGSSHSVLVTYILWLSSQLLQTEDIMPSISLMLSSLTMFWQQSGILYLLSVVMFTLTLVFIRQPLNLREKVALE